MKLLIFILSMTFSVYSIAQCKGILKNEIDEFTGDKKVLVGDRGSLTYTMKGTKCKTCNTIGRLAIGKIEDRYYIRLHLYSASAWSVTPGNTVEIKLKDGNVFNFNVSNSELSNLDSNKQMVVPWHGYVYFNITKEFLARIQEVEMDLIRVEFTSSYATTRVSRSKQVMEFAKCVEQL